MLDCVLIEIFKIFKKKIYFWKDFIYDLKNKNIVKIHITEVPCPNVQTSLLFRELVAIADTLLYGQNSVTSSRIPLLLVRRSILL